MVAGVLIPLVGVAYRVLMVGASWKCAYCYDAEVPVRRPGFAAVCDTCWAAGICYYCRRAPGTPSPPNPRGGLRFIACMECWADQVRLGDVSRARRSISSILSLGAWAGAIYALISARTHLQDAGVFTRIVLSGLAFTVALGVLYLLKAFLATILAIAVIGRHKQ